ncbi:MAG: hypothetical protein MJ196_06465 [Treponemataceae bacterium]|nr:hypothetical protein [Treponemataceae bacterium]
MKVFASNFLEEMSTDKIGNDQDWNWNPADNGVNKIVASGAGTSSRESTYAAESDNRADTDRPNEGMLVA